MRVKAIIALGGEFVRVEADERAPYQGSVEQIMDDVADLAAAGVDEAVFTLHTVARDVEEYSDLLGRFHAAFRTAGI